jgi:hypothetical protein
MSEPLLRARDLIAQFRANLSTPVLGTSSADGEPDASVVATLLDAAGFEKLMKLNEWNDVVIIAKGNHIQHFLNGTQILDFTDNDPQLALKEGVIALQLHAGAPMWTEFKNLRVKEL